MSSKDLYREIPTIEPERLKKLFEQRHPQDWQLLDVRQPLEYRAGHIPGARLLPVADLVDHLQELDPQLPTVVYCAAGVRSHAAASLLLHHGFCDVCHLPGGFPSWQGERASGLPQTDLAPFLAGGGIEVQIALAWMLEQGAQRFYRGVATRRDEAELQALFCELGNAEEGHKQTLLALYEGLTTQHPADNFPAGLIDTHALEDVMEGGFQVSRALQMATSADPQQLCGLAMAIEVNAWDHYLWLQRQAADEDTGRLFEVLAGEERMHLRRLAAVLEALL